MVRALKTPSKNLRACCWVGMHVYGGGLCCVHAVGLICTFMGEGCVACMLLGSYARLWGKPRAVVRACCWVANHVIH